MSDIRSARRRRLRALLLLAVAVGVAALVLSRVESSDTRVAILRLLVVLATLAGGWTLSAALRRALGAQRAGALEAPQRSFPRRERIPLELRRLQADIDRAQRSEAQYRRGLAARLESIAARRSALRSSAVGPAGLRESAPLPQDDTETGTGAGRSRARGPSLAKIARIVRRLEEL